MSVTCPVCVAGASDRLLHASNVPVMMHQLYATSDQARQAPRATLDLLRCRGCGFVWNRAFDPERLQYDATYENNQAHSPVFGDHIRARAQAVLEAAPSGERLAYLEVGCGQGVFLDRVVDQAGERLASAEGYDPAFRGTGESERTYRIHSAYFNKETAKLLRNPPNVVVTRHTIEHVPDPVGFLRSVREALGSGSRAVICVETPDVNWILKNHAIQDFFYEHCSIFTPAALGIALGRAGFVGARVDHVFGGQYLWALATAGKPVERSSVGPAAPSVAPSDLRSGYVELWRERVRSARQRGRVALWGAGAKGVTFALLVDPDGELLDHAIDINPEKQGHYLPGSGLQVLSPESAVDRRPATVFVMNPLYCEEIRAVASTAGINADFIPIN